MEADDKHEKKPMAKADRRNRQQHKTTIRAQCERNQNTQPWDIAMNIR
jgi:hypothetical protein